MTFVIIYQTNNLLTKSQEIVNPLATTLLFTGVVGIVAPAILAQSPPSQQLTPATPDGGEQPSNFQLNS